MKTLAQTLQHLTCALLLSLLAFSTALANEKVNINTADAATLAQTLHNVGPAKAQAIVDYRQQHGPFRSPEELTRVRGIGLATVERNADRIEITPTPQQTPPSTPRNTRPAAPARNY